MGYRYYGVHRPIGIGCYPKPSGNRVLEIVNFDKRDEVPEIGWSAWGWIEYEKPLSGKDARAYELKPSPTNREE